MAITDHPQFSASVQRLFRLPEQPPRHVITDHMPFMKRRVEKDQIKTLIVLGQAITKMKVAGAFRAIPGHIVTGALQGQPGFVAEHQMTARVCLKQR